MYSSVPLVECVPATMRGFHTTVLTHLALGEVVPCRQEARRPKRTSEAEEQTLLLVLPLRSK